MTKAMKFTSEYDGEIRRLKDDLYQARRTIVCLMPEPVQEILDSYYRCTSRIELHQWESNVIDQLVELAKPVPRHTAYDTERAYCPLCGGSAQSIYQSRQGFSLPIGLQRHLEGWGNTHQCDVTVAVFKVARDWAHDKFHEIESVREAAGGCPDVQPNESTPKPMPSSRPERLRRLSTGLIPTASRSSWEAGISGALCAVTKVSRGPRNALRSWDSRRCKGIE
jgi:hypothetical protein